MRKIGLFYNSKVEAAYPLAQKISAWLRQRGIATWECPSDCIPDSAAPEGSDLLLTLGGDGTILRAVPLTAAHDIPIFGINLGRVGFLTECVPDLWPEALEKVLAGAGQTEQRLMLHVTLMRGQQVVYQDTGLNDVVASRGAQGRIIRLEAYVDGALLTCYAADGLIIATATGSTAYSYAVGGPILPPWIENMLLVPVAPHLSLERPLVLDDTSVIEVVVHTRMPGILTVDGRLSETLEEGDRVRIERSPLAARFLRLRSRHDFYRTLVTRLIPLDGGCS